jgi:hypothetical protein
VSKPATIDDESGWDLDEPTKPDVVVPPVAAAEESNMLESASPGSGRGFEAAAQAEPQTPEPKSAPPTVADASSPAEVPLIADDSNRELDPDLDEDAQLMALIAAAKARADELPPPPPPQIHSSAPPPASAMPATPGLNSTADELDDDAELMALIAAAKARADDVPPPPPPQVSTSAPPQPIDVATAADIQARAGELEHELDDDAELMALIAAAKARADDVPPPPPRVPTSAPPQTAADIQLSSDTADNELDDDAELMALIAAAKARADDVPPPPVEGNCGRCLVGDRVSDA